MDGQFECLCNILTRCGMNLEICSKDKHVGEVESTNGTVWERVHSIYTTLPYKRMPGRIVIELVHCAIFWLNTFPSSPAVCAPLSPQGLITGTHIDYNCHVRIEFGEYVHTHKRHSNNLEPQTVGAIALRPTGNELGGHFFLSLATGRRLLCNRWTALPLPSGIICQVNQLACQNPKGLIFIDRSGQPLMAKYDKEEDIDENGVPELQACTNNGNNDN
eukprot:6383087-Ditylum_brightwellii.AAC.1